MATIQEIAAELKAKTDVGGILFDGCEYFQKPKWVITKEEISFAENNTRIMIFGDGWADAKEARACLRKMRVMVDA